MNEIKFEPSGDPIEGTITNMGSIILSIVTENGVNVSFPLASVKCIVHDNEDGLLMKRMKVKVWLKG